MKTSPSDSQPFLSRAQIGLDAPEIIIECHLQSGAPGFTLVGLPESALRESKTRVQSALLNSGLPYPREQRIVINLAPADLAKEGARYDLAIALSILAAAGHLQLHQPLEFLGELGLHGQVRPVRGVLCAALAANKAGRVLVIPAAGADQLGSTNLPYIPIRSLRQIVELLRAPIQPTIAHPQTPPGPHANAISTYAMIAGQAAPKRALTVAAAGGHHLLMVGPPGNGKSMLATALTELLPPLTNDQTVEVAAAHSAAGVDTPAMGCPPVRQPHHSATSAAMLGGGPHGRPGEIALANQGVLFLDELPHFKPSVLDNLREPLQSRSLNLVRARYQCQYPAAFQLVAAMNPCPSGRSCQPDNCPCTPAERQRYQRRISGPLLDRIDLHVRVPELKAAQLLETGTQDDRDLRAARDQVRVARMRQLKRQRQLNHRLSPADTHTYCRPNEDGQRLLTRAMDQQTLSARSLHSMCRVARTIADLSEPPSETVTATHVAEALSYRRVEWER